MLYVSKCSLEINIELLEEHYYNSKAISYFNSDTIMVAVGLSNSKIVNEALWPKFTSLFSTCMLR